MLVLKIYLKWKLIKMTNKKIKSKRSRIKIVNKVAPMLIYSTSIGVNKYPDKHNLEVTQSCNN